MADHKAKVELEANLSVKTTGADALPRVEAAAQKVSKSFADMAKSGDDALSKMLERLSDLPASLDALVQKMDAAKTSAGAPMPGVSSASRAGAMLDSAGPSLAGARYTSDLDRISSRMQSIDEYIKQAKDAGQDTTKLETRHRELVGKLEESRKAVVSKNGGSSGADAGAGGGTGAAGGAGGGFNFPPQLQQMFNRIGGQGLGGMGMLGRGAAMLGGAGLAIGAGAYLWNSASKFLEDTTSDGRREVMASADLARQYGYDGNANRMFRGADGRTNNGISRFGYSAKDAMRVAASYDVPGRMTEDVTNILGFARTTGIDESKAAGVQRIMSVAGLQGSQNNLETLKMAMTEGLKQGISQSTTLQNLAGFVEKNYRAGTSTTRDGLNYQAALLTSLARTGSAVLKGDAGAQAAGALNNAITGGGNLQMEVMLANRMGGTPFTAKQLGLEGEAATNYTALAKRSPVTAFQSAFAMMRQGKGTPEAKAMLAKNLQGAFGGDIAVMYNYLKENGMSEEQALEMSGGRVSSVTSAAAKGASGMGKGASINVDPQGANTLEAAARKRLTLEADTVYREAIAALRSFGALDNAFFSMNIKIREAGITLNNLSAAAQGVADGFAQGNYGGYNYNGQGNTTPASGYNPLKPGGVYGPPSSLAPGATANMASRDTAFLASLIDPKKYSEKNLNLSETLRQDFENANFGAKTQIDFKNPIPDNLKTPADIDKWLKSLTDAQQRAMQKFMNAYASAVPTSSGAPVQGDANFVGPVQPGAVGSSSAAIVDMAGIAIDADGFESLKNFCTRWVRQVLQAAYPKEAAKIQATLFKSRGVDAKGNPINNAMTAAQNFRERGLGFDYTGQKLNGGDVLFQEYGAGGAGHTGIYGGDGFVYENSAAAKSKDARQRTALAGWGKISSVGRLSRDMDGDLDYDAKDAALIKAGAKSPWGGSSGTISRATAPDGEVMATQQVNVNFTGLDKIVVTGLTAQAANQVRTGMVSIAKIVTNPASYPKRSA